MSASADPISLSAPSGWIRWSTIAMCCWISVATFHRPAARAQSLDDPVLTAWAAFPATFACRQCHYESQAIPNHRFDDPTQLKRGDLSRQNEMFRWVREDKHAIARIRIEPLHVDQVQTEQAKIAASVEFSDARDAQKWVGPSNVLSRRICDALGLDIDQPAGYQQFAESCLTCHGGYDRSAGPQTAFQKSANLSQSQPGISCLACHQEPGGETAGMNAWIFAHASLTDPLQRSWRGLSPAAKAQQGMRDLVTPSKQADLCIDCHVGNLKKGMFVTHAMYAAGHPPLPNFEMETFGRSMPQHWRSEGEQLRAFEEAGYPGKDDYFSVNFPGLTTRLAASSGSLEEVAWNTRKSLIGAAAVRRRGAEMIVSAAETEGVWGDYAMYDCGACHHELRRPSLRQSRGYPGAPGRPRLHEWPDILLQTIAPSSFAASAQQRLVRAVSDVPFGNPVDCRNAAVELRTALNASVERIESEFVVRSQEAWMVIQRMSGAQREALLDYPTARQVMWSILVAANDLETAKNLSPQDHQRLRSIRTELDRWSGPTLSQGTLISSGAVGIAIELPAGRDMFIFRENLHEELERRANYQPDALAESLQRIHRVFSESMP